MPYFKSHRLPHFHRYPSKYFLKLQSLDLPLILESMCIIQTNAKYVFWIVEKHFPTYINIVKIVKLPLSLVFFELLTSTSAVAQIGQYFSKMHQKLKSLQWCEQKIYPTIVYSRILTVVCSITIQGRWLPLFVGTALRQSISISVIVQKTLGVQPSSSYF